MHSSKVEPSILFQTLLALLLGIYIAAPMWGQRVEQFDVEDPLLLMDEPIYIGEEDFIQRVENRISGRSEPLGLQLSGGSARAFAHIGALKRLEEAGLVPDFIVANSMGSIVGLLYAAGHSPDDILSMFLRVKPSSLIEPVFPLRGGILNPSGFVELLEELVPYTDIQDLPIPIIVVCEDLRSKRRVVLAEGNFKKILAGSFALPFYFPPQEFREYDLIDGGLSNLAALSVPYRYSDNIIISTTFYQKEMNLDNPITNLNVALNILKSRPAVGDLKKYNPFWIRCNVEAYSFMDWSAIEKLTELGYRSADEMLSSSKEESSLQSIAPSYMDEIRLAAGKTAETAIGAYTRSGAVHTEPAIVGARMGVQLMESHYSRPYFGDRNRLTLGTFLKGGYSNLNLKAFYQPLPFNRYQSLKTSFSGFSLDFFLMPARRVRISGFSDANFTGNNEIETQSFRGSHSSINLFIPFLFVDSLNTGPTWGGEIITDEDFLYDSYMAEGGIRAHSVKKDGFLRNAELTVAIDEDQRTTVQGELSFLQQIAGPLYLKQRVFSRIPLYGTETVSFYPKDSFRPDDSPKTMERLIISNTTPVLRFPKWNPAFGEILILQNLSFGPFFDFRAGADFGNFDYTLGGGLETALSLLGLKPVTLKVDTGWSIDEEDWFLRLSLWS